MENNSPRSNLVPSSPRSLFPESPVQQIKSPLTTEQINALFTLSPQKNQQQQQQIPPVFPVNAKFEPPLNIPVIHNAPLFAGGEISPNNFVSVFTIFFRYVVTSTNPVGKIAVKAVCGSVFLTIWHCILFFFLAILPTGKSLQDVCLDVVRRVNTTLYQRSCSGCVL